MYNLHHKQAIKVSSKVRSSPRVLKQQVTKTVYNLADRDRVIQRVVQLKKSREDVLAKYLDDIRLDKQYTLYELEQQLGVETASEDWHNQFVSARPLPLPPENNRREIHTIKRLSRYGDCTLESMDDIPDVSVNKAKASDSSDDGYVSSIMSSDSMISSGNIVTETVIRRARLLRIQLEEKGKSKPGLDKEDALKCAKKIKNNTLKKKRKEMLDKPKMISSHKASKLETKGEEKTSIDKRSLTDDSCKKCKFETTAQEKVMIRQKRQCIERVINDYLNEGVEWAAYVDNAINEVDSKKINVLREMIEDSVEKDWLKRHKVRSSTILDNSTKGKNRLEVIGSQYDIYLKTVVLRLCEVLRKLEDEEANINMRRVELIFNKLMKDESYFQECMQDRIDFGQAPIDEARTNDLAGTQIETPKQDRQNIKDLAETSLEKEIAFKEENRRIERKISQTFPAHLELRRETGEIQAKQAWESTQDEHDTFIAYQSKSTQRVLKKQQNKWKKLECQYEKNAKRVEKRELKAEIKHRKKLRPGFMYCVKENHRLNKARCKQFNKQFKHSAKTRYDRVKKSYVSAINGRACLWIKRKYGEGSAALILKKECIFRAIKTKKDNMMAVVVGKKERTMRAIKTKKKLAMAAMKSAANEVKAKMNSGLDKTLDKLDEAHLKYMNKTRKRYGPRRKKMEKKENEKEKNEERENMAKIPNKNENKIIHKTKKTPGAISKHINKVYMPCKEGITNASLKLKRFKRNICLVMKYHNVLLVDTKVRVKPRVEPDEWEDFPMYVCYGKDRLKYPAPYKDIITERFKQFKELLSTQEEFIMIGEKAFTKKQKQIQKQENAHKRILKKTEDILEKTHKQRKKQEEEILKKINEGKEKLQNDLERLKAMYTDSGTNVSMKRENILQKILKKKEPENGDESKEGIDKEMDENQKRVKKEKVKKGYKFSLRKYQPFEYQLGRKVTEEEKAYFLEERLALVVRIDKGLYVKPKEEFICKQNQPLKTRIKNAFKFYGSSLKNWGRQCGRICQCFFCD